MSEQEPTMLNCPLCGEPSRVWRDGYCEPCADAGQRALDLHNAEHDAWARKSGAERARAIQEAIRRG